MEVVVAAGLEAEELSPSPPQAANKKAASIATANADARAKCFFGSLPVTAVPSLMTVVASFFSSVTPVMDVHILGCC
jgi:hypothetical protein